MKYAVVYFNVGGQDKYVGSLMDYKAGEFSADPILMEYMDAHDLVVALQKYVRNEECKDNEASLYAFEDGSWGFYVESIDTDNLEYMGALVTTNGDTMLIEDEEQAAFVAHEAKTFGLEEIEYGSEDFEDAMARLELTYANIPQHIYRAGKYTVCKEEDWRLAITTLQQLADYINVCDEFPGVLVGKIIEANGWDDLTGENDYDICSYMGEKVTLDENTCEAKVVDDNSINERIGQRIQELRKEAGMTQKDLAEKCGMAQPNIARIEAGTYATSIDVLSRIAEALGKRIELV